MTTTPQRRIVLWVPYHFTGYTRTTHRGKWTPSAKAYHESQRRLAVDLRTAAIRQIPGTTPLTRPVLRSPYRVGLVVTAPPVKRSSVTRGSPNIRGDLDNRVKALVDAASYDGLVAGDTPPHFQGIVDVAGVPTGYWPHDVAGCIILIEEHEQPGIYPTAPPELEALIARRGQR